VRATEITTNSDKNLTGLTDRINVYGVGAIFVCEKFVEVPRLADLIQISNDMRMTGRGSRDLRIVQRKPCGTGSLRKPESSSR